MTKSIPLTISLLIFVSLNRKKSLPQLPQLVIIYFGKCTHVTSYREYKVAYLQNFSNFMKRKILKNGSFPLSPHTITRQVPSHVTVNRPAAWFRMALGFFWLNRHTHMYTGKYIEYIINFAYRYRLQKSIPAKSQGIIICTNLLSRIEDHL